MIRMITGYDFFSGLHLHESFTERNRGGVRNLSLTPHVLCAGTPKWIMTVQKEGPSGKKKRIAWLKEKTARGMARLR